MRNPAVRLALGLAVALGLLLASPPTAVAHESDPRLVTTLTEVVPPLPAEVVVQAQAGIATQLVASNPTDAVLEVLGRDGGPFLRLSSAGVFADVTNDDFFTTSNPNGAAPPRPDAGAPRWVRISSGDSWGWYDHRLHPEAAVAPEDDQRPARLADFEVPFRYGGQDVTVRGRVDFRPLLGSFLVSADAAPSGVTVQALPGRLPALFVTAEPGTTVLGRDGEPFLRFTPAGVEVNTRSRTHVEDRAARGEVMEPPAPTPEFRLVAPGASSYTWLDARLRYPDDLPPQDVLRATEPTVVQSWEVPIRVDGAPAQLTGDVTWVPEATAAAQISGRETDDDGRGLLLPLVAAGALAVLLAAVLAVRRSRRGAQGSG